MFVYSLRAQTVKFFGILLLSAAALVTLILFIPSYEPVTVISSRENGEISYTKIKTNDDRIAFLSQFGWEVDPTPAEETEVTVPSEFDRVFLGYNEIQKQQGLDLSKYKRRDMMRYTYTVKNYDGYEGTVYANLLVFRNRVVAGDICSADIDGFIHGFSKKQK